MSYVRFWAVSAWILGVAMIGFDGDQSLGWTCVAISFGLVLVDALERRRRR